MAARVHASASMLPSYQAAVGRLDWLELVAPYLAVKDYAGLSAVNTRFYTLFAPRLWNDPLTVKRRVGFHPDEDLEWYYRFVYYHVRNVRASTRALVLTLDFRNYANGSFSFSSGNGNRSIADSLSFVLDIFPNLRCIFLDGHLEVDPTVLAATGNGTRASASAGMRGPYMLSLSHCRCELSGRFFASPFLRDLVYLDISALSGSVTPLIVAISAANSLPHLRILKARNRELDNATAAFLFKTLLDRLWSVDLSGNKLTDAVIDTLVNSSFASLPLQLNVQFRAEGKLVFPEEWGNGTYGAFKFIHESEWSHNFSHPERYFVDTPTYSAQQTRHAQSEESAIRANGLLGIKQDDAEYVKTALAGSAYRDPPDASHVYQLDVCMAPVGITHLNVSNNAITTAGIEKLVRESPGQLEYLACDAAPFQLVSFDSWSTAWPRSTKLYGMPGSAHVFRPLFSSNLRALRVHHSLVTQVPSLEMEGVSALARLWMAETAIRERCEMAFPAAAFVPDANPRMVELTLTRVPRRSSGPLIEKLVGFLKLAARQERDIRAVKAGLAHSRRSPGLLSGLRVIRLEFEVDPLDDVGGLGGEEELDAGALMDMDDGEGFSFFAGESGRRASTVTTPNEGQSPVKGKESRHGSFFRSSPGDGSGVGNSSSRRGSVQSPGSSPMLVSKTGQFKHFPYGQSKSDSVSYSGKWKGQFFTMPVWIGDGVLGDRPAINEYMALLREPALRSRVGPAMPHHVAAGVPAGRCLFYDAWEAMVLPREVIRPTKAQLEEMRDVVEAVRSWRGEGRRRYDDWRTAQGSFPGMGDRKGEMEDDHGFWTGRLEVVVQDSAALYHSSEYWR